MVDVDLSVEMCGIRFRNPVLLASGLLGSDGAMMRRVIRAGAGGVVTKSVSAKPRAGNRNPTVIEPDDNVFLNAVGLASPGCEAFAPEIREAGEEGAPVIASIFGGSPGEFAEAGRRLAEAGADMLEVNISCPQFHRRHLRSGGIIAQDEQATREAVQAVRDAVRVPLIVKLSPNVTDITVTARAALDAGADALSAINTVEALEVDVTFERPVLANLVGGLSGPAIRCISQRKVAAITAGMNAGELRKVPVIGVGGIRSGADAARFILLGAHCVQVGSALLKEEPEVFGRIVQELGDYMKEKGYACLDDFRGNALHWLQGDR